MSEKTKSQQALEYALAHGEEVVIIHMTSPRNQASYAEFIRAWVVSPNVTKTKVTK